VNSLLSTAPAAPMRVVDVIRKKRDGQELSRAEIESLIEGYTRGTIPDYQVAAWLMAGVLRGFTRQETAALTEAMLHSGEVLDLSEFSPKKVDKHSTGGVGDKTSLVLAPVVAAGGLLVPMISGRGLGHTGGTLDKLESIPGFNVHLSLAEFRRVLRGCGCSMMGQTEEIAPADRKLYALRDVTATVESIPLITASIMSKKLAGGADALVLDVKCGPTAFMKTQADATTLAQSMVDVGTAHGMQIRALITRMDAPLGWAIGNALEVMESVEILRGEHGDSELAQMSFRLAAEMLIMGGAAKTLPEARALVEASIRNGSALETMRRFVALNGGDIRALDDFTRLPQAGEVVDIRADRDGFLAGIDGRALGLLAMDLGAGRRNQTDRLDLGVGLRVSARVGQKVAKGDLLFQVHAQTGTPIVPDLYLATLQWSTAPQPVRPWLLATIGC